MKRPPRFWTAHEEEAVASSGARFRMKVWGWSDASPADAAANAAERTRSLMAHGGPGTAPEDWYYPASPLREELLDTLEGTAEPLATVTRNRYGASVLNTDALVIADIDLPDRTPSGGVLRRLLGKGRAPDASDGARERIAAFSRAHPELGVHSYRTSAGFRVLLTGTGCAPGDARSTALLEELDSDPLYVRLCRVQRSFRARLSPKPWRLGLGALTSLWPEEEHAAGRRDWLAHYEEHSRGHAVCAREDVFGPVPSPDEQRVIDLHDRATASTSGLPLA